jgi:hypothetical protein
MVFEVAEAYEAMMGRWSRKLAMLLPLPLCSAQAVGPSTVRPKVCLIARMIL